MVQHALERDVRHVVELSYDGVQQFGAGKAVLGLDLGCEVAEDDDGGCVRSDEDGADEEFKVLQPFGIAVCQ